MKVEAFVPGGSSSGGPWDEPETRFRVVDETTGEVLDDAQGYGYRTAQKAHAAWGYKHRDKSKDGEKRRKTKLIQTWLKDHEDFADNMEDIAFCIAKGSFGPDVKFNAKLVGEMLADGGFTELGFTPAELLKVFNDGALCPMPKRKKKRKA